MQPWIGMKNPVRPAPAPPDKTGQNFRMQRSSTQVNKWEDFTSDDPFFVPNVNRPKSVPLDRLTEKKKPPPRPPPPKFAQKSQQKPNSLLMNLFSRQPSSRKPVAKPPQSTNSQAKPVRKEMSTPIVTGSLINLNSPPSSPSQTSRSSSDGVSINSFGSDCTRPSTSNATPSLGASNPASFFESGFEDDFNFFTSTNTNIKTPEPQDPWSINFPQDPFSPPPVVTRPELVQKPLELPKPSVSSRPTIIRAKPTKPSQPPDATFAALKGVFDAPSVSNTKTTFEDDADYSLPMPSIPPPPLPPEVLQELERCPDVPPRPKQRQMDSLKKPYGIALYDYAATHPDDLSFQTNDVVFLLREISADWLYGEINGREGMFPANFINVMVPLNTDHLQTQTVTALYSFAPETWDDLEFPEGATIKVVGRVSKDWLYGEYGGKSGQFPAAYVDHIPQDLPQRKT